MRKSIERIEIAGNFSMIPLYMSVESGKAMMVPNAYHLTRAETLKWIAIESGAQTDQWHIILPQTIPDASGNHHQTHLVGKQNIEHVKIPKHILMAPEPCTQCGAPIAPIESHKVNSIACEHCSQPNPADWSPNITQTLVTLLNPSRMFDAPIEGMAKNLTRQFGPALDIFQNSLVDKALLSFGDDTPLRVYTINGMTRQDLEEYCAVGLGTLQTTGQAVSILQEKDYTKFNMRGNRLLPPLEMLQRRADDEIFRQKEAANLMTDQLQMLYMILTDTTGTYGLFDNNRSTFENFRNLHEEHNGRDGTSQIELFTIAPEYMKVLRILSAYTTWKDNHFLSFYDYEDFEKHVPINALRSLNERRKLAIFLAQHKYRTLNLPSREQDVEAIEASIQSLRTGYEKATKDDRLPRWSSTHSS